MLTSSRSDEKLQQEEENEPEFVKDWYRLAPWHQYFQDLLEKRSFVQRLRKELKVKERTILGLEEKLGSLIEELKKEQALLTSKKQKQLKEKNS